MRINFNVPPYTGKEFDYIKECVENQKICGDGPYTAKDNEWIEKKTGVAKAKNPSNVPVTITNTAVFTRFFCFIDYIFKLSPLFVI